MAKKRIIYRVTYFKDQEHWDNGDCNHQEFNDVNKAVEWGKENDNDFGFQIDRVEQTFKEPPIGNKWRKEKYGWEQEEEEKTLVYDGNSDFKIDMEVGDSSQD